MFLIQYMNPISTEMLPTILRVLCAGYGVLGLFCFWRAMPARSQTGA